MSLKITFIGAGSLVFARTLFTYIMSVPELQKAEISFTDINPDNLEKTRELCQRDLDANGIPVDIEIPLKYGVDQCVGDTLCTGGIMYGQRVIAAMLDFCKDIREVSEPGAIMLNYSNPNAMATWACNKYGGVKTLGLCHGEIHGEMQIAEVLGIPREELDITCAGINHQTWYVSVKYHGKEMLDKILPGFEAHEKFREEEKVRIDILKRFGYYSTESNGHLSEYVAWYRKRPDEIKDWINLDNWINGETGGYLRVTREERNWFETDYPKIREEEPKKLDGSERGKEHCSYIIESLETGRKYRGHFNVMNEGCITNLPYESVVEVPCYVDGNGISIPKLGDLPLGCAAVCSQSIWVQKLAVEAAVHGDVSLLKQAALMDPLTGAVCNPPEIWQMIDEMLVAQEEWLPQYKEGIEAAKTNLKEHYVTPRCEGYKGAAVVREKTVEEVAAEHAKRKITV